MYITSHFIYIYAFGKLFFFFDVIIRWLIDIGIIVEDLKFLFNLLKLFSHWVFLLFFLLNIIYFKSTTFFKFKNTSKCVSFHTRPFFYILCTKKKAKGENTKIYSVDSVQLLIFLNGKMLLTLSPTVSTTMSLSHADI